MRRDIFERIGVSLVYGGIITTVWYGMDWAFGNLASSHDYRLVFFAAASGVSASWSKKQDGD